MTSEPTTPDPQTDAAALAGQAAPQHPQVDPATPPAEAGTLQVDPAAVPQPQAAPPAQPLPGPAAPAAAYAQPTSGAYPVPQYQQPQPPGVAPQTAPQTAPPTGGVGLGVLGLLLGLFGVVVWALPIDEDQVRQFTPFPFAIGGIVLSIMCLNGRGRGGAVAGVGLVLSGLALIFGLILVTNYWLHYIP
jgi:hypothetical protein